jgi:hypothetical protein
MHWRNFASNCLRRSDGCQCGLTPLKRPPKTPQLKCAEVDRDVTAKRLDKAVAEPMIRTSNVALFIAYFGLRKL